MFTSYYIHYSSKGTASLICSNCDSEFHVCLFNFLACGLLEIPFIFMDLKIPLFLEI